MKNSDPVLDVCLNMLMEAATNWENGCEFCDHPVVLGVATPTSARMLRAERFGPTSGNSPDMGLLIEAVNAPANPHSSRVIFDQVSLYLGEAGVDEYERDAATLRRHSQIPLLVMLLPSEVKTAHMTVGIPRPRLQ